MFATLLTVIMIVNRFLDPDPWQLVEELKGSSSKKFRKLNKSLAQLVGVNPLTPNIKKQNSPILFPYHSYKSTGGNIHLE